MCFSTNGERVKVGFFAFIKVMWKNIHICLVCLNRERINEKWGGKKEKKSKEKKVKKKKRKWKKHMPLPH